ncbi:MAG: hypothetical protein AAFZ63_25130 [Bacteroidota bacterium]
MQMVIDKAEIGYTLASANDVDIKMKDDEQKQIDAFLDAIIKLREYLDERSEALEKLEEKLQKLFRVDYNTLTEKDFFALQMVYEVCKRINSKAKRLYANLRQVREEGICKKAINRYRNATRTFEEIVVDMHRVFFEFPNMPAFQTSDEELKAIFG